MTYTEDQEAAPLFRRWTAIGTIAGLLERKVWVKTTKGLLYPNLYTILVGHAGIGKSITIATAESFLREFDDLHIAPTSMTMASMVDALGEAKCSLVRLGESPSHVEYNSLLILADELYALIHTYDREFMAGLTTIYDGRQYAQHRRGKDLRLKIPNPQINILAGTTPSSLVQFMPEGAWDQGFASRVILVYSGDRHISDIFQDSSSGEEAGYSGLLSDLKQIRSLYGQLTIEDSAKEAFREWRAKGEEPAPDHPKLLHYCTRRTAHLLKLCMVASASSGNNLRISLTHFQTAMLWLREAEDSMPDIFKAGAVGGDSKAIDEVWHYVWLTYSKRKIPIPEHELIHFLRERVPAHDVLRVMEVIEREKIVTKDFKSGGFIPAPRQPTR